MIPKPENRISQLTWVVLSAFGFVLFVAVAVVLINFSNTTGDIKPQIFYFLLVLIGLIAAGFLFGALKSHAKYTGKVYGGTLELGGPTVIFVIVIYLGIKFSPAAKTFTLRFTVFGSADKSELVSTGMLKVLFDKPDSSQILNGTADFTEISTDVQGKKITVIPVVTNYYVSAREIKVPSSGSPIEIHLKKKPDSTAVSGIVVDTGGQPVRQAVVELADGSFTCKTDEFGNFKLTIPIKEGAELPVRVYYKSKLCYNNTQMLSRKVPLTLQIH
ncbi:MAG TPA: hypothetical protein VGN20_18105 [Mucilaginibacter sp.]|jgi:hypothetical protein